MTESNCCGAKILDEHDGEGICSDCKEHCAVSDNELDRMFEYPMNQLNGLINQAHELKVKYGRN